MLLCVVLGLVLLPALGREVSTLVYWLPFGWVGFLKRTLPEVSVNWSGLGMVILCSALVLVLSHYLFRWLFNHRVSEVTPTEKAKVWKAGWTLCLFCSFWLLFGIVMSSSGLFRTLQWFAASKEPFYVVKSGLPELRQAILEVQMACADSDNLQEIHKTYASNASGGHIGHRGTSWERFDLILLPGHDQRLKAALVVPRAPAARNGNFGVIREDNGHEILPMQSFRETLAALKMQNNGGQP